MKKFCNGSASEGEKSKSRKTLVKPPVIHKKYHVYLNCKEMCHTSTLAFFHELVEQVQKITIQQNKEIVMDSEMDLDGDDDVEKSSDCSNYIRQLKTLLGNLSNETTKTCVYLVIDNAESLKYFKDAANLFLMLSKLNEYLNIDNGLSMTQEPAINMCILFITEMDWHSLISDCDLMSRTEATRPFIIFFNDYTKDQMKAILQKTAGTLVSIQYNTEKKGANAVGNEEHTKNVQFFAKLILDVFHPICKDLNEMQYLIQIYYDQVVNSIKSYDGQGAHKKDAQNSYEKMLIVWNNMKPFLKQALNQIYLRNSAFESTSKRTLNSNKNTEELSREFETLNLQNIKAIDNFDETCNQLPKLMKFLLISSYIATHNPTKYDKKLFEYNNNVKTRKTKFTAQKFQQTEENQRAAALKTQSFELNRVLAIFFAIASEFNLNPNMNLSLLLNNIKSLKSLNYLQQTNSSYSCVDESKFKCLLDFETINQISNSVQFNIKQYLAEYLTI